MPARFEPKPSGQRPLPLPEDTPRKGRARIEAVSAAVPLNRFQLQSPDKLRGGYYTPAIVAAWLARWALRSADESFLEPSAGDGAILAAGVTRLLELGASADALPSLARGVELVPAEGDAARARLSNLAGEAARNIVEVGDFFAWFQGRQGRHFDAVLGNPPFLRYQSFPEPARGRAMLLMQNAGLRPNKLTNMWVPFVVAATEVLNEGGRLALVIPAELLQVSYAAQLRGYLCERFTRVHVVTCNELFFHGAEQEVVLLMCEGALSRRHEGHRCRVSVVSGDTVAELVNSDPVALLAGAEEKDIRAGDGEKWLKLFLSAAEIEFMREIRRHPRVSELSRFARVDVGVVTGNNGFFVLRHSDATRLGLQGQTVPLVSRSAHLRGAVISAAEWEELASRDERVNLLDLRADTEDSLNRAAAAYVRQGEADGVHLGFKCSIRKPWFRTPSLWNPDAFLFRQIHDFPRFVRNEVVATATDTIHRVTALGCDPSALVASTYTHLTAASAEIVGRSYGGGVLELEPTEAERLLVGDALDASLPLREADALIRAGRLSEVLEENDRRVLIGALGMSQQDCRRLKGVWDKMRDRRQARNGKRKPKNA